MSRLVAWLTALAVAGALLPAGLGWVVLGLGAILGCPTEAPGCAGLPLGPWLKWSLDWAWLWAVGGAAFPAIAVLIGGMIRVRFWMVFLAAGLPPLAWLLPMTVVMQAAHAACMVNEGGVGDCVVWGTSMGMTFHAAPVVGWMAVLVFPASGAGALLGVLVVGARAIAKRPRADH